MIAIMASTMQTYVKAFPPNQIVFQKKSTPVSKIVMVYVRMNKRDVVRYSVHRILIVMLLRIRQNFSTSHKTHCMCIRYSFL